jgi:hypothetical protein
MRIIGLREEVTAVSRKLHNEEIHNLYRVLATLRATKLRRMRWVRQEECMGE